MILDLREFDEFPIETTLTAKPGTFASFADEVKFVGEVKLHLAIQKANEAYFCQGEVTATLTLECSRCLESFERTVSQATDFVACAAESLAVRDPRAIDDELYVILKGTDMRVDVSEPVRQALFLSLDMKPLCSEGCLGLCPVCGQNLNEQTCDCRTETVDPRWEGLKNLKGLAGGTR